MTGRRNASLYACSTTPTVLLGSSALFCRDDQRPRRDRSRLQACNRGSRTTEDDARRGAYGNALGLRCYASGPIADWLASPLYHHVPRGNRRRRLAIHPLQSYTSDQRATLLERAFLEAG
jgi:hypothetical protein